MTTTITRQDCLVLPYAATSEDKAEQFAAAVETLYYSPVKAEVFEDGGKWYVAVVKGMEHISDPENDERIGAAFILLMHFDLVESDGDTMEPIAEMLADIPPAQEALAKRARRSFRIEDKLDAILTALVGTEGAEALGQPAGDSHRLPSMPPRMTGPGK